jgi:cyclin-A
MKRKENSTHSASPLNRPRGKRKALAELPKSNGLNMNHDSAPRPSKPRTRSAARAEAEAAMKRQKAGDAAHWQMDTRQPDAESGGCAVRQGHPPVPPVSGGEDFAISTIPL